MVGQEQMQSGLADFIEGRAEAIVEQAIVFARTVDVGTTLDDVELRDHLPEIIEAIVADLRTPQTRDEEVEKSEGRAVSAAGTPMSAAATHAVHRAHSGFSISSLVAEYRAMRASVLRAWADSPEGERPAPAGIARFNEAIDEAIAESVSHYADEVERWRDIFLGVLGHDLRNPLNAILMTSEHLAGMAVDAPIAKAAERLLRSGEAMRVLLDRLLVYNRSRMGIGFKVQREEVDLAEACRECIEQLRASLPDARIDFQAPDAMHGNYDAGSIGQALSNLVVNAHKYGSPEGTIRVELGRLDDAAVLAVSNHGDGIAQETLDSMFEPLRRAGVANGDLEHASLGLGLFIVDQIAKAHGGSVQARSDDGLTTFRLEIPQD